jgi:gas vesicle protein
MIGDIISGLVGGGVLGQIVTLLLPPMREGVNTQRIGPALTAEPTF